MADVDLWFLAFPFGFALEEVVGPVSLVAIAWDDAGRCIANSFVAPPGPTW